MSTTDPDATSAGAPTAAGPMGAGLNGLNGGNGHAGNGRAGGTVRAAARPGPRERKAILVCVAAIIVYLVLAYLVFVRPGVSRSEHLLAVLLPAAILALSADLWPRLQAGLRASLALLYGVFSLVTGLVCVARLRVEGASASALCGLLPLAAGAVLIALGLWLLWVSRKRGGSAVVDAGAPRSAPGRGAVRRLLGRGADQPGHHRHRAPERAGQGRGPRAPAREGHPHHARRSRVECLVRARH